MRNRCFSLTTRLLISFRLGFAGIDLSNILQVCNSIIDLFVEKSLIFLILHVHLGLLQDEIFFVVYVCVLGAKGNRCLNS